MTDNAMVLHENGAALSVYQGRDDVRELGDRLMAMHPAASEVGSAAMRAAAQLALLLGANPLPGVNEVHIWKDNKGRNCMSLGINYWRRKGNEWGGYVYEVQPRPMKPAELTEYGIPAGTTAAICKGVRTADMIQFKAMGFTTREVWDMCGRTGIGTQGANEYAKNGRPAVWTSLKRAETDMLRQLFPAEFGSVDRQVIESGAPAITIEAGPQDGAPEIKADYSLEDFNEDFGMVGSGTNVHDEPEIDEDAEYEDVPAVAPPTDTRQYSNGDIVHSNLHSLYDEYLAAHNGNAPEGVAHLMNWKAKREREGKNGNGKPAPSGQLFDMEPEPAAGAFVDAE